MALHWPYIAVKKIQHMDEAQAIIHWCLDQFGPLAYQHWTYNLSGAQLLVSFSSREDLLQFKLTWIDTLPLNSYTIHNEVTV